MILTAAPLKYLSELDEASFFSWLNRIPGVRGCRGVGEELHVDVDESLLDRESIRELIALYRRYGVSVSYLAGLSHLSGCEWIRDPSMYWHLEMFGKEPK